MSARALVLTVVMLSPATAVSGQAPATPAPAPAPVSLAEQPPTPPPNFVYSRDGRRDPFVSLVNRGTDASSGPATPADGVAGLTTDELVVRGLVESQGVWAAMVSGAAGRVFTVRPGDRLADGTVRTITAEYLVIQQQVHDPLSLEKQREVRKYLRGGEKK